MSSSDKHPVFGDESACKRQMNKTEAIEHWQGHEAVAEAEVNFSHCGPAGWGK